jgi:protein-disulfide isomerase
MTMRVFWTSVVAAGLVMFLAGSPAAQSAADYQALRKELDLMRARLAQMQREIDALKAVRTTPAPAPAATGAIVPMTNVVLNLARAPLRGALTAKVTMVEISDFECPFCGRFARDTAPQIKKQYVDSKRIGYAFVHMPIATHRFAFKASEAAACAADQGKFWEMHDVLFARQGSALAPAFLPGKGEALGLDKAAYNACLQTSKHAAYIKADVAQLQQYARTGTPTFYIGTMDPASKVFRSAVRIVGAKPLAVFQQALDEQLARTGPGTAP